MDGSARPRSLGEWHLLVADELREIFTRAAAGEGLTFAEGRALRLIGVDATQQHLTEVLAVDRSRVSTLLGRLESAGLIERDTHHGGDRRIRRVRLTDAGAAAVARIGVYLDTHSPLVRRLDDAERHTFFAPLRKIADR